MLKQLWIPVTLLALLVCNSCLPEKGLKIGEKENLITLENEWVLFQFDRSQGTYSLVNKPDDKIVLSEAVLQVNEWRSDAAEQERTWTQRSVQNEFGEGLAMDLKLRGRNQPDLLFSVTVYKDYSFVDISGGIFNTLNEPIQLKELFVLADGAVYPGHKMEDDFALIDGFSGGEPLEYGKRFYSPLTKRNALKSRNNLLLTFTEGSERNTLIMGGLSYQDYDKYAYLEQARSIELEQGTDHQSSLLCYLNLPVDTLNQKDSGESLRLMRGRTARKWQYYEFNSSESATSAVDEQEICVAIGHLNPEGKYTLGLSWWRSLWHGNRKDHFQSVFVEYSSGDQTIRKPLFLNQMLPLFDGVKKEGIQQVEIELPGEAVRAGSAKIVITHADWELIMKENRAARQEGQVDPNVYLSEIWLRDGNFKPLLASEWTEVDAGPRPRRKYTAQLFASDPVGKRVDPGQQYLSQDRFYINAATADPYLGLENYGRSVQLAQQVDLSMYDFPTVCLWYAQVEDYGGGKADNTSVGAVNEMTLIKESGFLNYSRAAVRLVPDSYMPNNQQGWWDDAHWQKPVEAHNGSKNGRYLEPYETSEKWGKAVSDLGGIPLTYFQAGFRSEDYAREFPEHMLFNKTYAWKGQEYDLNSELFTTWNQTWARNGRLWSYDYTDPGFIAHLKEVYADMKKGGIKGLMFDYPASGWAKGGGMEDPYSTTAAAYRNIFRLPNEGLGPEAYVHERNMERGSDVSIGNIASMRTENDTDQMDGATVTRCGLRWYKNRVLYNQDTDSKNIARLQGNRDAVRAVLTMAYVTTGRLLLANSFSQFSPETFWDICRTFPYHTVPQTARPADAFVSDIPRVYDYKIDEQWHQVAFYNEDFAQPKTVSIRIAGPMVDGALELNPEKSYYVYDFWNDTLRGLIHGEMSIEQTLRPGEARMLSVREQTDHPQVLSTNRHLMQGYLDLENLQWDSKKNELSGTSKVVANDPYLLTIANNKKNILSVETTHPDIESTTEPTKNDLTRIKFTSKTNQRVSWKIKFK